MLQELNRLSRLQVESGQVIQELLEGSSPENRFKRLGKKILDKSLAAGNYPVFLSDPLVRHMVDLRTEAEDISVRLDAIGSSTPVDRRDFTLHKVEASWRTVGGEDPFLSLTLSSRDLETTQAAGSLNLLSVMEQAADGEILVVPVN